MRIRVVLLLLCVCLLPIHLIGQDDETPLFPASQDYYAEAFVSDATPYIGEEIVYTFRYYAYTSPSGFIETLPDFRGFWLADSYELVSPRIETVDNRQYNVQEIYDFIVPLTVGEVIIEPSSLEIPETVFREGLTLETNAIIVDVQPLPEPVPEAFHGAIGQFDIQATLDQETVTVGQPLTLTVTINGAGNLEQLRAPNLPDLTGWRTYPNPPRHRTSNVGGLRLGEKTFEWLLIPDLTGSQVIPPIVFSYFDPVAESYQTISNVSFTVEVFPGEDGTTREQRQVEDNESIVPLMPVSGNFRIDDDSLDLKRLLLWIVPPLLAFLVGSWVYGRQYYVRYQHNSRRKHAINKAMRELRSLHKVSPELAYLRLIEIIQNYLSEKSGHTVDLSVLSMLNVADLIRHDLQDCITEAEAGRYAPVTLRIDPKPLIVRTAETLQALDGAWDV